MTNSVEQVRGSFTPKPLSEPYVNLSIHTALRTRTTSKGCRLMKQAHPPQELAKIKSLESADPFATTDFHQSSIGYSRYYESVRHKQTHRYFSLSHAGSRLFRLTSSVCFSCSVNMPRQSSCRLNAGYHASNNQVIPCTLLFRSREPSRHK